MKSKRVSNDMIATVESLILDSVCDAMVIGFNLFNLYICGWNLKQ